MRTILIIFIIYVNSLTAFSQEKIQKISILLDSISKYNVIEAEYVGYPKQKSIQFERFNKLIKLSTINELRAFLEHPSPVIKCYSIWGLAKMQEDSLFSILIDNIEDDRMVQYMKGDIKLVTTVGDFLIDLLSSTEIDDSVKRLSDSELTMIYDQIIKNDNLDLAIKDKILMSYPLDYLDVKRKVKNGEYKIFLVKLAKFKKEEDLSIILDLLKNKDVEYYCLNAIREFPHNIFYDKVIEIADSLLNASSINSSKIRIVYQVLAQYPKKNTAIFFDKSLKETKGMKHDEIKKYIWLALTKYPNEIFMGIYEQIKLAEIEKKDVIEEKEF